MEGDSDCHFGLFDKTFIIQQHFLLLFKSTTYVYIKYCRPNIF